MSPVSKSDVGGDAEDSPIRRPSRTWAVVRIALGSAQIMGATVAAYLLLVQGVNAASVTATAATALCLLASRLLFADADRGG